MQTPYVDPDLRGRVHEAHPMVMLSIAVVPTHDEEEVRKVIHEHDLNINVKRVLPTDTMIIHGEAEHIRALLQFATYLYPGVISSACFTARMGVPHNEV